MSKSLKVLLFLVGLLIAVGLMVPATTSNCGGNSAALAAVKSYVSYARMTAFAHSEGLFQIPADLPNGAKVPFSLPGRRWIHNGGFLVSTQRFEGNFHRMRQMMILCDRPFTNVPQRRFGKSPPTHAVGYSDGSTGLISPREFAALDLSHFRPLDELFPPNQSYDSRQPAGEESIGK